MAKVTLLDLTSLENQSEAVSLINDNMSRIADVLETLLSRDGTAPNAMGDDLNMDGNRILNLPAPTSDNEPARHGELQDYVDAAEDARDITLAAKSVVVAAETNVEEIEGNIEEIWSDVQVYGTPAFYDFAIYAAGVPEDSEILFSYVAIRGFDIASGSSSMAGVLGVAATAETVVTVRKNGSSIGTLTWAASGTEATTSVTSDVSFVAGDVLDVVTQSSADDTAADFSISITATRNP